MTSPNLLLLAETRADARQQPVWDDPAGVDEVRGALSALPPLVEVESLMRLRAVLAEVAGGRATVVQAGDCAEDPAECTADDVARKVGLIQLLAGVMEATTQEPVVTVGRIAGQYAKPRSSSTEQIGDLELPVYRGHLVNRPDRDALARRHDVTRLLESYRAASKVMSHLYPDPQHRAHPSIWTSHEALILDYEVPLVRPVPGGGSALTSTHWPWIGNRTRQPGGAHVELLAGVINPVACKIGPDVTLEDLLTLCTALDPWREPGRLTLTVRMGIVETQKSLPALVRGVREAGFPVIWMVDPMHANTVVTEDGYKTRALDTLLQEVQAFQRAVVGGGGWPGGIHLEATPDSVTECVDAYQTVEQVGRRYTTLCDPRLNPRQALSVVSAWEPPGEAEQGDTAWLA